MAKRKVKEVRAYKNKNKIKKEGRVAQIVIGALIIFLMVVSIAGVSVYNKSNTSGLNFGKYHFVKKDQLIYTTIDGKELGFRFLPQQTLEVTYDPKINNILRNSQYLGIIFDPNIEEQSLKIIELARFELSNSLPRVFSGVTETNDLYSNLPVINCNNATREMPLIYFTEADINNTQSSISLKDNCIIVKGDYRGLLIAKDRLIYEYYDVFNKSGEEK